MPELGPVAFAICPIRTERLTLREPEAWDRASVIDLFASPEMGTYIGSPRPRDEIERAIPAQQALSAADRTYDRSRS